MTANKQAVLAADGSTIYAVTPEGLAYFYQHYVKAELDGMQAATNEMIDAAMNPQETSKGEK